MNISHLRSFFLKSALLGACVAFFAASAFALEPGEYNLRLWVKADDLAATDGQAVEVWPDASGRGNDLKSKGEARPTFKENALGEHAAVVFEGSRQTGVNQFFDIPIGANWRGITVFAVGTGLKGGGWLDTCPGRSGCLRACGWIQLTGTKASLGKGFYNLTDEGMELAELVAGVDANSALTLTGYGNGRNIGESVDENPRSGVVLSNARIGNNNGGERRFNGMIVEYIIYEGALPEADREATEQYLLAKYGLAEIADAPTQPAGYDPEAKPQQPQPQDIPLLKTEMSYFGNSFGGQNNQFVQAGIFTCCALPDGTLAAISVWDERHKEIGLYKDGKCVGGIGGGGGAIAADDQYIYAGTSGMGKKFAGIRRLTHDLKEVRWPGIDGWPRFETPEIWIEIQSIAVDDDNLYVSAEKLPAVRVFDKATGKLVRTFEADGPEPLLALDSTGKLWIGTGNAVKEYTKEGKATGRRISGIKAGALACDTAGHLLVADVDKRMQIIRYDVKTLKEVGAIGQRGGIYAPPEPGRLTPDRLPPLTGLGVDANGDVYVSGQQLMRAYTPTGSMLWELECTQFTNCGDIDPASDGTIIYTGDERYTWQPGQPSGKDWKRTAITVDGRRFPEMASGANQVLLRRLNGVLYQFSVVEPLLIHRQEPNSAIFAPCGMFVRCGRYSMRGLPKNAPEGDFFWSDLNGNGLIEKDEFTQPAEGTPRSDKSFNIFVDSEGTIWEPQPNQGTIRSIAIRRFTDAGVPVYDFADMNYMPAPREFQQAERVMYYPQTDTMYVSGFTWDNMKRGNEHWGNCGREVICYADWSKPARRIRSRMVFPQRALNIKAITVAEASNRLFAGQMETQDIFAYDTLTGKLQGVIKPDLSLIAPVGWIDIDSGIRAFTRKNGEIMILSEEVYSEKQLVFRLPKQN